jgi:hypothetical protein
MRGRWLEGSESLAEPWLAELAADERRLHTDAPFNVLEDEPVAMGPKHDAKAGAHFMHGVPASYEAA